MAPLAELHAAQDDVADFVQRHRFAPIDVGPEPRQPAALHHINVAALRPNLIDTFAALPASALKVEAMGLQARMLGAEYSTRDFAIVSALVQRLEAA